MTNFIHKTFSDSYIFNYDKNNTGKSIAKEINRKLIEYILKAERIDDKKSNSFLGIREDIKRQQTSSLIYSILMRDDVVLCVNSVELPRAFKVFEAIDIKEGTKQRKVFIDVSGLVKFENGYYVCKNIYTLITYLTSAVVYLLYRNEPIKFVNNSNITLHATKCYIECFSFVLDYLRPIGYQENKSIIQYLIGLFFLVNLMGKDLDQYSRNVSANIAGINPKVIKSFELYFDPEDFINIDTFISMLIKNFKLNGFSTEVFMTRWIYHFQKGTEYAIDLFTSFLSMIVSAYCGTYIVNQKQIEKCCGKNMVKLSTSIIDMGVKNLESFITEEVAADMVRRDRNSVIMSEAVKMRNSLPDYAKIERKDFSSKDVVKTKVKNLVKYYMVSQQEVKISAKLTNIARSAMNAMDKSKVTDNYEVGVLEAIFNEGKKYFNERDRRNLMSDLDNQIGTLTDAIKKDKVRINKDLSKKIAQELTELRKCTTKL